MSNIISFDKKTISNRLLCFLAFLSFILASYGAWRYYSPVPYWDQWDSYLDFYLRVSHGDWFSWFEQHNEHRIIFSKLLFWLDIRFFEGKGYFLIAINYVLQLVNAFALYFVYLLASKKDERSNALIFSFIFTLLFSWIQEENFAWAFQSQFFSVYTFALLSLLSLYYLEDGRKSKISIVAFSVCSLLTTFSMANGILIFLVAITGSLFFRLQNRYRIWMLLWGVLLTYVYFTDLNKLPGSPSIIETLVKYPIDCVKFFLIFVGTPFYYISGSRLLATGAGVVYVAISLYLLWLIAYRRKAKNKAELVMILFIGFITASALATSIGRVRFGIDSAISSRYTTPMLLAWVSIGILTRSTLTSSVHLRYLSPILIVLVLVFFANQKNVLSDHAHIRTFERKMAALSIDLNIYENEFISKIYPSDRRLIDVSERAKVEDISIFKNERIEYHIGEVLEVNSEFSCVGNNEEIVTLVDKEHYRIKGWVYDISSQWIRDIDEIIIVDTDEIIVGRGLVGQWRPDVSSALGKRSAISSGWQAYVNANSGSVVAYARKGDKFCRIGKGELTLPLPDYSTTAFTGDQDLSDFQLMSNNGYVMDGYFDSSTLQKFEDYAVFGSWVSGDAFAGSAIFDITVLGRVKMLSLAYTTGPSNQNQHILFYRNDEVVRIIQLPLSYNSWTQMTIDNNDYDKFELRDSGINWGEWHAFLVNPELDK